MNKYLKRGLWGILVGFILGVIFAFGLWPLLISNSVDCIGCVQSFLVSAGFILFLIIAPFVVLMDSGFLGLIIGSLLTLIYWFVLGILVGWIFERIKSRKIKK